MMIEKAFSFASIQVRREWPDQVLQRANEVEYSQSPLKEWNGKIFTVPYQ